MQLSIMNKVKNGELSIDDAISQARKNNLELFHQKVTHCKYSTLPFLFVAASILHL